MVDDVIGRLLMSSLHQGIGDVVPGRLAFYETWLTPEGMRDGRIGLASLGAVLSFLHREGPPTSDDVAMRAGSCAAEWTLADLPAVRRRLILRLPTWWRTRVALRVTGRLVRSTVRGSRVRVARRRGVRIVTIGSMVFEQLRDPAPLPMRAYYGAALDRALALCGVDAGVTVVSDSEGWRLEVRVRGPLVESRDTE